MRAPRPTNDEHLERVDPRDVTLIVIAKEPLPGRCKTRLCPPLEPEQAAALAAAALADTFEAVEAAGAHRRLVAFDGAPAASVPPGFEVVAQPCGGLDARLAAAFDEADGPALLVGMDTPQLTAAGLSGAIRELCREGVDAVLGPAFDGGYWAIGLRRPTPAAFLGVPMSAADTCAAQRRRLDRLGLDVAELERMRDFDTIEDAHAVAANCPDSRFAATLAGLRWPAAA